MDLSRRTGRWTTTCETSLRKGEEIGWFEHGSTIILLASEGFRLSDDVSEGMTIRAGQSLLRMPA